MGALIWLLLPLAIAILGYKARKGSNPRLPPGPPGDLIIGHLRYLSSEAPEDKITELSKVYGEVIHLRVFHRHIIFLNTLEAAVDLLDKRSSNYSDRPDFPVMRLMGWASALVLQRYGKTFQKHRRLLQQSFSHQRIGEYGHIQLEEARRLAVNLLEHPENIQGMLSRFAVSIIIQIAYGHRIVSDDDPYLEITRDVDYALTNCGSVGSTPVDLFPILEHFPSWFPGAFFATKARGFSNAAKRLYEYPFSEVRKEMAEGRAKPCFLSHHLEQLHGEGNETEEELEDIKAAAGNIYSAGSETTWSAMSTFLLAMSLHPECQMRAQKEIDALLGGSRLPEINDRESLPYMDCILQECHRWLNSFPLGVPHRAVEDDIYKGMFIPKGSLIFPNTRAMSTNDSVYHDPYEFKPSRYLPASQGGKGEPHPVAHFGFGRRICPGRHLADVSLWMAMATILTLCNVKKAVGPDGKEITPVVGLESGFGSHPKPYKCVVELRDSRAAKLVNQVKVELTNE